MRTRFHHFHLIPSKQIPRVDLLLYIVQIWIIPVRDDGLAALFERGQVVYYFAAEERAAVLKRRLVDDDRRALGLDTLHHALDAGLAEVVGVGFHGQAVDADHRLALLLAVPGIVFAVGSGQFQYAVGDKILARAVAFDNGFDQVLRHVPVVGQQLLGILGQAVAAVAAAGIDIAGHPAAAPPLVHMKDLECLRHLNISEGIRHLGHLIGIADQGGQKRVGQVFDKLSRRGRHTEYRDLHGRVQL